ncbi:hypothetical protein METH_11915 [Leisingera methylohalidivorans DSM 14336]|uniref:Methylenetetrahydrofolate reductase n=2 Tax=Leisingera methylohalidivorans TaxID=133924 RepID=V9VZ99_9RHOB|nr:hypothetical protein METH_11915 [Leisingera methylohalidivorans DSM 14336]
MAGLEGACKTLVDLGYQPVPYVGARHLQNESQLREHLTAARSGGACRLLVLAGDRDGSLGPYNDAMPVLAVPSISDLGSSHIPISGPPEGHPRIGGAQLVEALENKLEFLAARGIQAFITTQFGFDAGSYASWINMLRARGIVTPINIGITGVTSIPARIKYSVLCGVGPSLSALRKRSGAMVGLLKGFQPAELIDELSQALVLNDRVPVKLHFFPFGGAKKTFDWVAAQLGKPT